MTDEEQVTSEATQRPDSLGTHKINEPDRFYKPDKRKKREKFDERYKRDELNYSMAQRPYDAKTL